MKDGSEGIGDLHIKGISGELRKNLTSFYTERNRSTVFELLENSKTNLDVLFPEKDEGEFQKIRERILIEQISLFCKSAEDLGAFMFSLQNSSDISEFSDYLEDYHESEVDSLYRKFVDEEQEELEPLISDILNMPEKSEIEARTDVGYSEKEDVREKVLKTYSKFYRKINSIGKLYLEYKGFYRAYKHGYRVGTVGIEKQGDQVKENTALFYIYDRKENYISITDRRIEDIGALISDSDSLIKLLKDNFETKERPLFTWIE